MTLFEGGLVVALDIGSSEIRAAIGEYDEKGRLILAGFASVPSEGLRKGVIVNIEHVIKLISEVVEEAEHDAGRTAEELWVSLSSQTAESMNSRGVVAVGSRDKEISEKDIRRVLDVARAIALPMDREILHTLPQHYIVDDQPGVKSPCDMIGVRLGAEVHVITSPIAATENRLKAVNRSGFGVQAIVLDSLAATYGVLTHEEMDMGVLLVDIGHSHSGWVLLQGGAPWKSGFIPMGGDQISKDISIVLKTPIESAEEIKKEAGCCWEELIDLDEPVIVPGVGGRQPIHVTESELSMIIEARMKEMLRMIRDDIDLGKNIYRLGGGVVLCGGGARLRGVAELASAVFDLPVRVGRPLVPENLRPELTGPEMAVLMGILQYGHKHGKEIPSEGRKIKVPLGGGKSSKKEKHNGSAIWNWIKEFV